MIRSFLFIMLSYTITCELNIIIVITDNKILTGF